MGNSKPKPKPAAAPVPVVTIIYKPWEPPPSHPEFRSGKGAPANRDYESNNDLADLIYKPYESPMYKAQQPKQPNPNTKFCSECGTARQKKKDGALSNFCLKCGHAF